MAQEGMQKELPLKHVLVRVDFNENTRVAKVEFKQIKTYRTIERYVTRDYVRYPIYSDWKQKSKSITRSLKLTNENLECLPDHEDELVSEFSFQIVLKINREDMYPSWFLREVLTKESQFKIKEIQERAEEFVRIKRASFSEKQEKRKRNSSLIFGFQISLQKKNKKRNRLEKRKERRKKITFLNILLCFLTVGIYIYFLSKKGKSFLESRILKTKKEIEAFEKKIELHAETVKQLELEMEKILESISYKKKETEEIVEREKERLQKELREVPRLIENIQRGATNFIALKSFAGMTYEKIVGCYIIRNRENDKCYVGQSKDVLRRLKQHFKGTVPHNMIFAEDYYSASLESRENLFEVKIIPCQTKDELDEMERSLIEEYGARQFGYNGTSGNT